MPDKKEKEKKSAASFGSMLTRAATVLREKEEEEEGSELSVQEQIKEVDEALARVQAKEGEIEVDPSRKGLGEFDVQTPSQRTAITEEEETEEEVASRKGREADERYAEALKKWEEKQAGDFETRQWLEERELNRKHDEELHQYSPDYRGLDDAGTIYEGRPPNPDVSLDLSDHSEQAPENIGLGGFRWSRIFGDRKEFTEDQRYIGGEAPYSRTDESWGETAYRFATPVVVELVPVLTVGIVASPLLVTPAIGTRVLYYVLLGGTSAVSNALAQQMRIGFGDQEEFSYEENAAAAGWGMVPGLGPLKRGQTAWKIIFRRAAEGAVMGGGEATTRNTLEILSGKKDQLSVEEITAGLVLGFGIGGSMGWLEKALVKQLPDETVGDVLQRTLKDRNLVAKEELKAAQESGDEDAIKKATTELEEIAKIEEKFDALVSRKHEDIIDDAIKLLEDEHAALNEQIQEAATDMAAREVRVTEEAAAAAVRKEAEGPVVEPKPELDEPPPLTAEQQPKQKKLEEAAAEAETKYKELHKKYMEGPGRRIPEEGTPERAEFDKTKADWKAAKDAAFRGNNDISHISIYRKTDEGAEVLTGDESIDAEVQIEDILKTSESFEEVAEKIEAAGFTFLGQDNAAAKWIKFERYFEDRFINKEAEEIGDNMNSFSEWRRAKTIEPPMERAGAPEVELDEAEVKEFMATVLDDFLNGKGDRAKGMDASDEIKARLISDEDAVQRLINLMQDQMKKQLAETRGTQTAADVHEKAARRIDALLGTEAGDEHRALYHAHLAAMGDPLSKIAADTEALVVRHAAAGVLLEKYIKGIIGNFEGKDFSDIAARNDAMVELVQLVPLMLEWKRMGSASGRLLAFRKAQAAMQQRALEKADAHIDEQLVRDIKKADALTTEQLNKQVDLFGDKESVMTLLKTIQQSANVEEALSILLKQQAAFQSTTSIKRYNDGWDTAGVDAIASFFGKVKNMGVDVLYSSMLSSPITWIKVAISNATMQYYEPFLGYVGSKFYLLGGKKLRGEHSKKDFEDAGEFWKNTMTNKAARVYGEYTRAAFMEAWRSFKSGGADFVNHFERIGRSAWSMSETGLEGAFGQTFENMGKMIDLPGSILSGIDGYTGARMTYSMLYAKAHGDWTKLQRSGQPVVTFDRYWKNYLDRMMTNGKVKNEDIVRMEAVLAAEEQGIAPRDMPEFIDNYVKENWNKSDSEFAQMMDEMRKQVSFTEELGEFSDLNIFEKAWGKFEDIVNLDPAVKVLVSPFIRTGRNILRYSASTSGFMAELFRWNPSMKKWVDKIWTKQARELNSGDPVRMAKARGKQVVSAGIVITIFSMWKMGLLTGRGNPNWKKRQQEETAKREEGYSIILPGPDGERYAFSYLAFEPFASVVSAICDASEIWERGNEEERSFAHQVMSTIFLTIANNISNKQYFKTFGDFFAWLADTSEDTEANADQTSRRVSSQLNKFVPSISNAFAAASNPYQSDKIGPIGYLADRVGGINQLLPPMRDVLGQPLPNKHEYGDTGISRWLSPINPVKISKLKMNPNDYIVRKKDKKTGKIRRFIDVKRNVNMNDEEEVRNAAWGIILELDAEFHFPTYNMDSVDLRTIRMPKNQVKELESKAGKINTVKYGYSIKEEAAVPHEGQNAYSRWQELYGNLKIEGIPVDRALVELFQDDDLAKMPSPPKGKRPKGIKITDIRVTLARKLLENYRDLAKIHMMLEFPILNEVKGENAKRTEAYYEGNFTGAEEEGSVLEEHLKTQPDSPAWKALKLYPFLQKGD